MANMNDVAKLANVSRGTVSNYINGVKVKDELAKRIEEAIEELNYIPDRAARSLKKQSSDTIAFILPTIWTPFFAELTNYIQLELQKRNLKMLLCNSNNDFLLELDYVKMAKEEKVRGIITISYSDIDPYITSNLPIVSIERYFNQQVPFVTSDNFQGARLAAKELHQRGSKKLLMVLRDLPNNLGIYERMNGFIDYCKHENLEYEVYLDEGDSEGFSQRIENYLQKNYEKQCPFDGIFAATDRYAEYILRAFYNLDWKIPEDVQLVGFDGARGYPTQPLVISTIAQNIKEIAKVSVDELLQFDKDRDFQNKHILPIQFMGLKTTRELE
ncbi:LacI family transcriptional regulator [Tetragenococcus halophilus subsp. flandriensis]|uniref:LacI family DNA-binding transcriptional regulator n=1 Tax=Tetragenococcus halophilus TaxID=51669 RepID=UPI0023EA4910|nr:LacI family DNA-binding transcriptional regulator [Tetragenococcus halophilus]GMA09407.1 LacI family transcriptional regulator [Tetragenococcus halophilus subsp. flandriensis]